MKLYYLQQHNGRIIQVLYDRDVFATDLSNLNPAYQIFEIDEIDPTNKPVCLDLIKTLNRTDVAGESKYKIISGQLSEKEGWVEYIETYDII